MTDLDLPVHTQPEAEEIVKGKTYPKVSRDSIIAKIANIRYTADKTTTICFITMQNGFKFIGHSTPASAENFDAEVGKTYAFENAFRQIWTHEGYLLRQTLSKSEPKPD